MAHSLLSAGWLAAGAKWMLGSLEIRDASRRRDECSVAQTPASRSSGVCRSGSHPRWRRSSSPTLWTEGTRSAFRRRARDGLAPTPTHLEKDKGNTPVRRPAPSGRRGFHTPPSRHRQNLTARSAVQGCGQAGRPASGAGVRVSQGAALWHGAERTPAPGAGQPGRGAPLREASTVRGAREEAPFR